MTSEELMIKIKSLSLSRALKNSTAKIDLVWKPTRPDLSEFTASLGKVFSRTCSAGRPLKMQTDARFSFYKAESLEDVVNTVAEEEATGHIKFSKSK